MKKRPLRSTYTARSRVREGFKHHRTLPNKSVADYFLQPHWPSRNEIRRHGLATLLSVLGLVLTTASVIASIAQYKAADLQAKAAVVSLAPQIEVRTQFSGRAPSETIFAEYDVLITSDGGPVRNTDFQIITWLDVGSHGSEGFKQRISDYFQAPIKTGRQRGDLARFVTGTNQAKLLALFDAAKDDRMRGQSVLGPTSLLSVTYRDVFDTGQREYFLISALGVTILSMEDGEARWRRLDDIPSKKVPMPIGLWEMGSVQQAKQKVELLISAFLESR